MHAEPTMFEVESTCADYALIRYYWPMMLAVCNTFNEYMCDDVSFGHPYRRSFQPLAGRRPLLHLSG
jgi:hypothetical protein